MKTNESTGAEKGESLEELFEGSKIMHLYELLKSTPQNQIPKSIPVANVNARAESMINLRAACTSEEGWLLQKESHEVKTLYRSHPESTGVHSIRLDGEVDAPVFIILALFHEVDLFTKWIPSYALLGLSFAKCVSHPSPTELMVHMKVDIPWPFNNRYCFFKCDGIDCIDDEVPQIGVVMTVRAPIPLINPKYLLEPGI